jgi:hypothetical protein
MLFNMESPCTKHIAISGHKMLRLHVATVEDFPSSADRDQLCWDLILESSKQDKLLWEKIKEIQGDDALKAQLIDYMQASFSSNIYKLMSTLADMERCHSDEG